MPASHYVEISIEEDEYADAASRAYQSAEEAATGDQRVAYPEPYNSVGCGWGTLGHHVEALAKGVASSLGLDWDCCHQTTLQLKLYCGTPQKYAQFEQKLVERIEPLKPWVRLSK